jgi:hypothetical protein
MADYMARFDRSPKILKAQSFQKMDWHNASITDEPISAIWTVLREVSEHTAMLYQLQGVLREKGGAVEALLQAQPSRHLLHHQPEKPRQKERAPKGRKRLPKPSQK